MIKVKHVMEKLSELPPLAIIALGVTLAIMWGARQFGLTAGANSSPQKSPKGAEVAAVIVDPTALNRATAAVEGLNITLIEMSGIGKENARVVNLMAIELDRIREEMRIQREIGRRDR